MTNSELRLPDANEALQTWREAERLSIRASARREAAEEAIDASKLAQVAARSTAAAAESALVSAAEASGAASATADAADKVAKAMFDGGTLRRSEEVDAIAATEAARIAHTAAVERAEARYRRGDGLVDGS